MAYNKEIVQTIADALANTDGNIDYYYDKAEEKVIDIPVRNASSVSNNLNFVKIEPMINDIIELMEDFALEQDADDVQETLAKILQQRNKKTCFLNFKRVIHDYPKSKKSWDNLEKKWLKERAIEFLDDIYK